MKYGFFDDENLEYVITTPKTPLPWINYLGMKDFFTLISNTCGGYTFYKDAKLLRITRYRYNNVPVDTGGKYYYINDNGTVWNPGWQPVKTELDSYECRHGMGYTKISSSKNGLEASYLTFVPTDEPCELTRLTLKNTSGEKKDIKLYSFVEWCLWNADDDMKNFQRLLSCGEVEIKDNTIYHKTEYRERRNHFAYYSVNEKMSGYDTSRDDFLGEYRGFDDPEVVKDARAKNSVASGWYPIGSHELTLSLAPGEEKTYVFQLGYVENEQDRKWEKQDVINKEIAEKRIAKFSTVDAVDKSFRELCDYWKNLFAIYQVKTGNTHVNRMVNIWNQYQCMITFNMSRSASYYESGIGRGMGFRDSCQDLLGFVHLIPGRARERIIDIASTQFENGSAYHQYQPLTKKGNADIGSGFNDDPLWLIACVSAYIRETGDIGILDEMVPFDNDMSVAKTLMGHLKQSFDFTVKNRGPHALPLIGRADWNDCLNLNCFSEHPGESFQTFGPSEGPVAESVFIAGMFVKYGTEYAQLCDIKGDKAEADYARAQVKEMYDAVVKSGWDGEWFLRAYDANGAKVGSNECDEGKIYIEPQGFCVMAGIGIEEGLAAKSVESTKKLLDTKYGTRILAPAYTRYHLELGEISSYPPGYKENAGIFCHNNPWVSCAAAMIGDGDRAFEVYKRTCPSYLEDISEIHRTEPYVYAQMIAGSDAPRHGEAKNSWLTGTAAWTFVNISQYILGVTPQYAGLQINPCVPKDFGDFEITRKFRNTTYHITVRNPDNVSKGVKEMTVNGTKVEGNTIPYDASQATAEVTVVMG